MQKHSKVYLKYFGYGQDDIIPCEVCGCNAVDIHHIYGRIGHFANDISNIMALCRQDHDKAHNGTYTKKYLLELHLSKLL